ncbi:MAG: hypothetical protein KIS76_07355 [Pyrinomonadaceae bacterium]|nr:hypothetical protein [Pyrinomonadaceae bacterium]
MNRAKIFITFIFLLIFVGCVSAQEQVDPRITKEVIDPLEKGAEFSELLGLRPKKIKNLELGFSTPNELEGYKFFNEGKLRGLKLGISTKNNVKEIFGKDCEDICVYDDTWTVVVTYFKDISKEITENGIKKKLIAEPQSVNKIYSVKLVPRNRISFTEVKFPDEFYKGQSISFGHDFSGNAASISTDVYTDSYGLKYNIFDKENYSTFEEKDNRRHGDLMSIEYTIPNNLEEKFFIEQK